MTSPRFLVTTLVLLGSTFACSSKPPEPEPVQPEEGVHEQPEALAAIEWSDVVVASVQRGHWVVETIAIEQTDEVNALLEAVQYYADGFDVKLPANAAGLPPEFAVGESVTVIAEQGVLESKVGALGLTSGASETTLIVVLGEAGSETGVGVALASGSPAPDARYRVIEGKPVDAAVAAELAGKLDAPLLAEHPVAPEHLQSFDARLPDGQTQVYALAVPISEDDPTQGYVSGLFTRTTDGGIVEIVEIAEHLDHYGVQGVVDLDGDGVDELIWDASYYEGGYTMLAHWTGDAWATRTLAGDGA